MTIRDFVIVDRLELEFEAGFGALTGETGAGKSILVDALSLVLGELVPKSLAMRSAEGYALWAGRPLLFLSYIARPFIWFLTLSSNVVLRLFGDKTSFTESRLSPDEIQEMVDEAAKVGSLDARTSELASRALDFRNLTAAAVMVPSGVSMRAWACKWGWIVMGFPGTAKA